MSIPDATIAAVAIHHRVALIRDNIKDFPMKDLQLRSFLGQDAASEVRPQILTSPDQAEMVQKNLKFIPNPTMVTSAHMQATHKMGSTPRNSVVGQDFHVWGTQNLYVVDGSIFPTSVGANPMQSIYTIAKIFADHWTSDRQHSGS